MTKIAKNQGVVFYTNSEINKIQVNKGLVEGIILNGKLKKCDILVSGADYYHTELLLDEKNYFNFKSSKIIAKLEDFQFVFLRQDPPFDMNYITSTYILDFLPSSTIVVNDPTAVRNSTEKLFTFNFKEFMPPTLVTKDLKIIEEFLDKEEDIITKPLYGNGGEGIHRFDKSNFNSKILEEYLHLPIMIQKFINEIEDGDRRIIFFDGEYHGSVARIPQEGNLKANFHAGGIASKTDLVYRDE